MRRALLPFTVRVVEPRAYDPAQHASQFYAVIQEIVRPTGLQFDRLTPSAEAPRPDAFDLVTFPEAFVPVDALLAAMEVVKAGECCGCIHVGVRRDDGNQHLLDWDDVRILRDKALEIADIPADLAAFSEWLERQIPGGAFNIGCVFAVDAHRRLRVCLHPKLVRSHFEADALPEHHMREGDLLTLITLEPTDMRFGTITLQPLICSDALKIGTDRAEAPPMAAIREYAESFGGEAPNHVDIVSVTTCTPQAEQGASAGRRFRRWHNHFQDAFTSAAEEPRFARHHFAAIVLSNYLEIAPSLGGGLSGVFLPVPPGQKHAMPSTVLSCWGRPKDETRANNSWSSPEDEAQTRWSSRGFVAGLDPFATSAASAIRIFGFDIHRLPRESSPWARSFGLTKIGVRMQVTRDDEQSYFETVR